MDQVPRTKVHQILTGLLAACGDAVTGLDTDPNTRVRVYDGPKIGYVYDRAIVVGLTDGASRPGYSTVLTREPGLGRPRMREATTVRCLLTLSSGDSSDTALADQRSQATTVLGALDDQLRNEYVRRGVWEAALITGDTQWLPVLHEQGVTLDVLFDVEAVTLL